MSDTGIKSIQKVFHRAGASPVAIAFTENKCKELRSDLHAKAEF